MSEKVTRNVVVSHPNGLCLRGASSVCRIADGFQSNIELVKDGQRASARDALEIVLLTAECGTHIVLEATGSDAENALDALAQLFADNFRLKL